jgi:prepilin-type N-terminal cleavage/methylation domain-containing protein
MKNKKGFTLIELIVSVTIIAVLTVAGVIGYGGASKKARDSRRMADLEKIRIALELYRQGTGTSYPATTDALIPTYLQTVPIGPKGETYTYTNSGYTYILSTTLEEIGIGYSVTNP